MYCRDEIPLKHSTLSLTEMILSYVSSNNLLNVEPSDDETSDELLCVEFEELIKFFLLDAPYDFFSTKYNQNIPIDRNKIYKKTNNEIAYLTIPKFDLKNILYLDIVQNFFAYYTIVFTFLQNYLLYYSRNLWGYVFCNVDIKKNLNISISPSH